MRPPIHSEATLEAARGLAEARMLLRCEIQAPGEVGKGFGDADGDPVLIGVTRCAITGIAGGQENELEDGGVESVMRYELAFPLSTYLEPNWRIAIPGFFAAWKKATAYALGAKVCLPNQVTGQGPWFECVKSGVSGGRVFKVPLALGGSVADGGCFWRLMGYSTLYEINAINDDESQPVEVKVYGIKLD